MNAKGKPQFVPDPDHVRNMRQEGHPTLAIAPAGDESPTGPSRRQAPAQVKEGAPLFQACLSASPKESGVLRTGGRRQGNHRLQHLGLAVVAHQRAFGPCNTDRDEGRRILAAVLLRRKASQPGGKEVNGATHHRTCLPHPIPPGWERASFLVPLPGWERGG